MKASRREFLKATGATSLSYMLGGAYSLHALAQSQDALVQHEYSGWENFHRKQWTWDKKTRGAHGPGFHWRRY